MLVNKTDAKSLINPFCILYTRVVQEFARFYRNKSKGQSYEVDASRELLPKGTVSHTHTRLICEPAWSVVNR